MSYHIHKREKVNYGRGWDHKSIDCCNHLVICTCINSSCCTTCILLLFSHEVVSNSFCNPVDCSPPDSSVHGIFQARILEWVVISFSRVSFLNPGIEPISYISCTAGRFFTTEPSWKPKLYKRNLISGNETKIKIAYRHQNASPA